MSINVNKISYFLNQSKEILEKHHDNQFKINKNNLKSIKYPRINIFLNDYNKNKFNFNFIETKGNIITTIRTENNSTSKNKKCMHLKNFFINNNVIIPKNPFINLKIVKTRNYNIKTINQYNSQKKNNNFLYNKSRNGIISAKYRNKNKKYIIKNISIDDKFNNKSLNNFCIKENIINNNNKTKYCSEEKKNKLINGYKQREYHPIKLFLKKKNYTTLEESLKIPNDIFNVNISKEMKIYKTKIKDYKCISIPGTDIFGKTKINQDSYYSFINIYNLNNYSVFAVFDGHGINGHYVSKFVKNYFQNFFENICKTNNNDDIDENLIYKELKREDIIKEKFKLIENFLLEKNFSIQYSGTTCIIIIHIEDKLICYNLGDSRAVYINKDFKCIQISKDHKPELPKEKMRIEENGGIVKKDYSNYGVYRVWSKTGKYPGLAMSRSIGDYVAKSLGVIDEPDFYQVNIIENKISAVIISSDGLWNILNNYQIEKIVEEYIIKNDCIGCINALVEEAKKMYIKKNIIRDDITIIVIFFELKN